MILKPNIWGPFYWKFLRTICIIYPNYPNSITKKKYYEFFNNLPLFLPNEDISTKIIHILNQYPILPYLDNRESLCRWLWYINNKINIELEKPTISIDKFYTEYYNLYEEYDIKLKKHYGLYKKIGFLCIIILLLYIIITKK